MPRLFQLGVKLLLKGASAGGSLEGSSSFRSNPQLLLSIKKTCEVTITVSQVEGPQTWKIGAYVFKGDTSGLPLVAFPLDTLVARANFVAAASVELKVRLEASSTPYVVVPCTLLAGQECKLGVQFSTPVNDGDGDVMSVNLMPKKWKKSVTVGEWTDATAGGPGNFSSFLNNPMFAVGATQNTLAHIILSQTGKSNDLIGMYIMKESDLGNLPVYISTGKQLGNTGFQSKEEAIISLTLKPTDRAVVIPCTSKVGSEGSFEITVFSEHDASITPISLKSALATPAKAEARPSKARPTGKVTKLASKGSVDVITRQASRQGSEEFGTAVSIKGEWIAGKNSGGCINHYTWRNNDQYLLNLTNSGEVNVRLQQAGSTNSIGFYILQGEGGRRKLTMFADELMGKGAFQRAPEVATTVTLNAGSYVVVPCTFDPDVEGRYALTITGTAGFSVKQCTELWSCTTVEGEWKGSLAGGCRNHATFANNAQFQLVVLQPCNLIVILSQGIDDQEPRSIGFYVVRSQLALEKVYSTDQDEAKGGFTAADEVWAPMKVTNLSVYNIIPCTFEPNIPQTYRIIVFADVTENYIKLTPIPNTALAKPASPVSKAAKAKPTRGSNLALGSGGNNNAARNNYMKTIKIKAEAGKASAKEVGVLRKSAATDWKMSTLKRTRQTPDTGPTIEYREFKLEGAWSNETAGGCIRNVTWKNNPNYVLNVSRPTKAMVMVAQDIEKDSDLSLNSIGVYITKCDQIGKRPLRLTKRDLVAASVFSESMDVSVEVDLLPDQTYIVVPCTYYPGTISPFSLSVFVESSTKSDISLRPISDDWHKMECKGQWKGPSAGGAKDCETFKNNPNVLMAVNQKGVYNVFLSQVGSDELQAIGFYIMRGNETVAQSDFGRDEEVSLRLELPEGDFTIIPACLLPGKEGQYLLTVYGEFPLAALETPEKRIKTMQRGPKKRTLTETLKRSAAKRDRVSNEILQTEQTYCSSLEIMRDKYMEPIKAKITAKGELISDEQFKVLFSNSMLILGYNSSLLKDIEGKLKSGEIEPMLGEVFLKHCDFLKIYADYCNNYNKALDVFRILFSNKKFVSLVDQCKESSNSQLSLTDYLIMPIQRIPRYVMLLTELSKLTDEGHPDYCDINAALGKIKEIAAYLNEKKREAENREKILELDKKLSGLPTSLISPTRKFLRESPATAVIKGKKTKAVIILFNDLLLIVDPKFKLIERLELNDTSNLDLPIEEGEAGFGFATKGAKPVKYSFVFNTPNERNTFVVDLKGIFRAAEQVAVVRTA